MVFRHTNDRKKKHNCSAARVLIRSIAVTFSVGRPGMVECQFVDPVALGWKLKELRGGAPTVKVFHVVYRIAGS